MTTSPQIHELAGALAKAQWKMAGAKRESANPFFKSTYADLASVWEACREPLTTNGLSLIQSPSADGPRVTVTTLLLHTSGQWVRGDMTATAKDDSPQAVGSIVTYLRRYALAAFASVCPVDDDGEAAQMRGPAKTETPTVPAGYLDWLHDLAAVKQNGLDALKATWRESKAEYRDHLTSTNKDGWERLKAEAAKVTAAAKGKA